MRKVWLFAAVALVVSTAMFCLAAGAEIPIAGGDRDPKPAFQHDDGESVLGVAFSDDGKLLFSYSRHIRGIDYGRARVWDRFTGAEVKCEEMDWTWGDIWSHENPIVTNRPAIVRCTMSGIRVRDLLTGKTRDIALREMDQPATGYVLSDASSVFVGQNMGGAILAWNLKTGTLRFRFPVPKGSAAMPVAISSSGKYLAIPGVVSNTILKNGVLVENSKDPYAGFVVVWSLKEPRQVFDLRWPHRVDAAAISADDKTVVFGGYNTEFEPGWLNAVSIATGKPLPDFPKKTKFLPSAFAFSPDGRRLCWGDVGGTLHIVETSAFHEDRAIMVPRDKDDEEYDHQFYYKKYVRAVGFSADYMFIASGGDDGRIRLWSIRSGREVTPKECPGDNPPNNPTPKP